MERFLELFYAIDTDRSEKITKEELEKYVKDNKLDPGMIERWENLFDKDHTGYITFTNFCDVLGLKPEEIRVDFAKKQASRNVPQLASDIEVIYQDMSLDSQISISNEARKLSVPVGKFDPREVSQQLKQWLDQYYEPAWHVVIADGSYWATYSYHESSAFHFRLNGLSYVIWRTPQ